jgi:hypothetical protein
MYGPPGNGKTISIKAIMKGALERGYSPLYVKSFKSNTLHRSLLPIANVDDEQVGRVRSLPCLWSLRRLERRRHAS